ncbi:MAG: DUF1844 domain-containing protein [Chlamydiota bacterium]
MAEDSNKLHEARFLSLVLSLHGSAWMAMGKVANPMTGKVEKDIEAARGSIDLLETLRVKTRGNLTREEEKILANALGVLQLNFVDEIARGGEEDKSQIPNPKSQQKNSTDGQPQNQNSQPEDAAGGGADKAAGQEGGAAPAGEAGKATGA